jgi:uncharacterized protein
VRVFHLILFGIPLLSLLWWLWAHWKLHRLKASRAWHLGIACAMSLLVAGYVWVIASRMDPSSAAPHPWIYALVLIWALVVLPLIAAPLMAASIIASGAKSVARRISGAEAPEPLPGTPMTRREMLGTTAIALPMIATFGATGVSIPQKKQFRIRDLTIPLPDLPPQLDGMRIAHISDTHVGKFTRGEILHRIADATNRLEADLVLLTGDLIDHSMEDLPEAMDMIERLHRRAGLFTIEGNHDLFEGVEPFVGGLRSRGIPLLRDESAIVQVRGRPVQIMGLSWHGRGGEISRHVDAVADQRDPDAFPILLAHHPHAFDRAVERGIPLTLAGHTHGGQLMVTPEIGPGPMMFKYWSGLYQNEGRSLVVSNGTGNWFPLRTAAPAEILHLTLRRA